MWPPWVRTSGPTSQARAVAAAVWASAVETSGATVTTGSAAVTRSPETTAALEQAKDGRAVDRAAVLRLPHDGAARR